MACAYRFLFLQTDNICGNENTPAGGGEAGRAFSLHACHAIAPPPQHAVASSCCMRNNTLPGQLCAIHQRENPFGSQKFALLEGLARTPFAPPWKKHDNKICIKTDTPKPHLERFAEYVTLPLYHLACLLAGLIRLIDRTDRSASC